FIAELEARGRRVPEAMSVIGFDDLERFSPRPALLTTVHQPFELIGRRAVELLVRRLAEPEPELAAREHLMLAPSLVIRATCRAVGVATASAPAAAGPPVRSHTYPGSP